MTNEETDREQGVSEPTSAPPEDRSDAASPGLVAGPLRMGIAGVLAGLIAWQLIHWAFPFFAEPLVQQENPEAPTARDQERMGIVRDATNRKNECCLDFDIDEDEDGNVFLDAVVDQWLPAIPAIGILWEF